MFTINDTTTAAINILGAIDALESALDRHNLDADVVMTTDQERELLTLGIRDTQVILGMHRKPLPKVLSLLSLPMTNLLGISRTQAGAALGEFRLVEEMAEGLSAPVARRLWHSPRDWSGTSIGRVAVRTTPHGNAACARSAPPNSRSEVIETARGNK
jgi:hypothetical protein